VELELLNHFALLLLSNPHVSSVHPFLLFCSVALLAHRNPLVKEKTNRQTRQ
jgi:hypothetical protein